MSYTENIRIFEIIEDFNIPLASNPNICATAGKGDSVVTIGDEVYVTDKHDNHEDNYAKATINLTFVEKNPLIFKELFV